MPAPRTITASRPEPEAAAPLDVRYVAEPPAFDVHTLAALPHGTGQQLPLPVLGDGAVWEVWRSPGAVQRGQRKNLHFAHDGDLLFLQLSLQEGAEDEFEERVAFAYSELMSSGCDLGYPHLLKVWHYFARINDGDGDAERYKRFSVGRGRSLPAGAALPAATCIGFPGGGPLTVFALAARVAGHAFENPRQVSAYQYPRQYGPVPPSFARAMLLGRGQLLVSGTAAVVGHETRHAGDASAQMAELIANLEALLSEVQLATGRETEAQALKLYLRHPQDLPAVQARWSARFPSVPCLFLQGDICRSDLLVEAEGFFRLR